MFKKGQKVVFVGLEFPNPYCNAPKINEIVTIDGYNDVCSCPCRKTLWRIVEYVANEFGEPQGFTENELKPLDLVLEEFPPSLTEEIQECLTRELEPVKINQ